jgi:hypothetical protein
MSYARSLFVITAMVGLLAVAGCKSSESSMSSAPMVDKAVVVTSGNGTTTIYIPAAGGGVEMLSTSGAKECPTCKADAEKYFLTGQLVAKCPDCGATRTAVLAPTITGHN